jgi:hypothetical protein
MKHLDILGLFFGIINYNGILPIYQLVLDFATMRSMETKRTNLSEKKKRQAWGENPTQ